MLAEPLTAEVIHNMPAGQTLDIAVAERVMDQTWQGGGPIPNYDGRWPWPPPYSTDITAAMDVLCRVRGNSGWWFAITGSADLYYCKLAVPGGRYVRATGDRISLAICRAALLARCREGGP